MNPTSQRIALDTGLSYHVLAWSQEGQGEWEMIVLLHGFLDFAWGWDAMVRADFIPEGRAVTVIAPDLRGHGDSDRVGAGGYYHFMDYLADLHALLEHPAVAAPGRLALVGHSMGGSVASYYAGAYPDRVARLAVLEGLGPPDDPQSIAERVPAWIAAWRRARRPRKGYPDVAAAAARLRAHDPRLDEAMALWLAERGTARGADGQLHFKHDPLHVTPGPLPFRRELAEGFWRRVTCPVLLVEGEVSDFRHHAEEAARREACFADRRKVVIPGAGHMMQRHQPAALARALREFLF